MADESDSGTPSRWMRVLGTIAAVFIFLYGAAGLLRNDLHVALSKSDHEGVHLHGVLAGLCFAGILMMSVGIIRLLGPAFGDGGFDFEARRRRFAPLFVLGLVLFVVSQAIAKLRS
jgi:hypothetical protein